MSSLSGNSTLYHITIHKTRGTLRTMPLRKPTSRSIMPRIVCDGESRKTAALSLRACVDARRVWKWHEEVTPYRRNNGMPHRGNPHFHGRRRLSLVAARIRSVARACRIILRVEPLRSFFRGTLTLTSRGRREVTFFVYRIRRHQWTQLNFLHGSSFLFFSQT